MTVGPGLEIGARDRDAVPPAGGPEAGVIEKTIRCENSEVLPSGSVAVAVTRRPAAIATGRSTSIVGVAGAVGRDLGVEPR